MLVIGLLLVLIAIALIVGAVYDGAEPATMEAFGSELDTTVAGVFFTGVGTTLLLFLGLWMLKAATARSRKQRADRKAQRMRHRESVARLEQERNELRAENERLAKAAARPSSGATGPASTTAHGGTADPTAGREPVDLTPGGKHADPAATDQPPTARPAEDDRVARDHQPRT
jgi:hypothetical protein